MHRRKRRREAVLRRFRRAVRKLTLVKSIVDQLQSASILTPYNQYELFKDGIYDLVLAGRTECSHSNFWNNEFMGRIENFHSEKNFVEQNPLLASSFTKINHLLNLLSPSHPNQQQQQQQHPFQTSDGGMALKNSGRMELTSRDSYSNTLNYNDPAAFLDPDMVCCAAHRQGSPYLMLPIRSTMSPPPSHMLSTVSRSRNNSHSNLNKLLVISRQNTVCYIHLYIERLSIYKYVDY